MKKLIVILYILFMANVYAETDDNLYYTQVYGKLVSLSSSVAKVNVYDASKKEYHIQNFKLTKQTEFFDEKGSHEIGQTPKGKNLYFEIAYPNLKSYKTGKATAVLLSVSKVKENY